MISDTSNTNATATAPGGQIKTPGGQVKAPGGQVKTPAGLSSQGEVGSEPSTPCISPSPSVSPSISSRHISQQNFNMYVNVSFT